jgi:hypothetical protein
VRLAPALVLLSLPTPAGAYVLRRTDGGAALHWTRAPKVWADESLDPITGSAVESRRVVDGAVGAWAAVEGAALGDLETGSATSGAAGYDAERPDENRSMVLSSEDLPGVDRDALAVTLVTYDTATGRIVDADVLVRSHAQLATDGNPGHYDLPSVLTHEVGHALGLAHEETREDATMYPETGRGDTEQRTLSADDVDGILAVYGPTGEVAREAASAGGGCGVAPGSPEPALWLAVGIAIAVARRVR